MTSAGGTATGTLAIVGVGLLGGSVALAAKQRGLCRHVIGIGRNAERLQAAVDSGVIDSFVTNIADAEPAWDFVVVGTPVDRIVTDVRAIAERSSSGTLITDVGSVKSAICCELASGLPDGVEFVGSHPLAGSEKRGFEVATAELFDGRVCVVTPDAASDGVAIERTVSFWESLGSRVVRMAPTAHDVALATTSHVPHVVAAALVAALPESERDLAARGFRDTTRIASGDPDLWVAILLENAAAVEASFDRFGTALDAFREAIRKGDAGELKKHLELAKRSRDALK